MLMDYSRVDYGKKRKTTATKQEIQETKEYNAELAKTIASRVAEAKAKSEAKRLANKK